ncbi:MAG: cytochrome P450 [Pseudomonadales bacterium]|nr:cytochrome P450 [Pseudomonadales bacterium]NIX07962.1 cytochrome P450 [Pseudomonadales bacterium]
MSEAIYENPDVLEQDPWQLPLEEINPAQAELFENDRHWAYFERLRRDAPVHYCRDSIFGPYWSVTKYADIKHVDTNYEIYSSEPTIVLDDQDEDFPLPMFIAMDPPKHDRQRKEVAGVAGPRNLAALEPTIRQRVCTILDSLPVGEAFNWVDLVSIELTTQMLATLFDFPFEDRRKLTRWSDVATAPIGVLVDSDEARQAELLECLEYFTRLWNERVDRPPGNDLVSMLAHGESTKNMEPMEYLGNLILLIVGGNDTTRNSISGGVLALNQNPDQYQKLREDQSLIPNMCSEIIRWQTPLAYMRRVALEDTDLGGQRIKAGDKVAMWYVSGNRDPDMFEDPDAFIIDRANARKHIAFGFGIHRCMGNRVAEMQLRVLWEEILRRFHTIELVGEPVRVKSSFVKGYLDLPVILHPH